MKALLMHPDRDFDLERPLPAHEPALTQDLEVNTLLSAMAGEDKILFNVARQAIFSGLQPDLPTILHRQEILRDCLAYPALVREFHAITIATIEGKREYYIGLISHYPSGTLYDAVRAMQFFTGMLKKLRAFADQHAGKFHSPGLTNLLVMLQREFSDEYFATIQNHLEKMKFKRGTLQSAQLGRGNEGINFVLRQPLGKEPNFFQRLLGKGVPGFTYRLADRDEAGARILSQMYDRGINLIANALGQSAEHIIGFFQMLRTELSFYIGCLNLHDKLLAKSVPISFPEPAPLGSRQLHFTALHDVGLALSMSTPIISNDLNADGKDLLIITGANQGGKSSFLRALGLAQLMMQAGMYVAAASFTAELCANVFTHYLREEDTTMKSGKLDEELARMSQIVSAITPHSLILLNESFSSTNEREGSEIARQVITALLERQIKVFAVTHLYQFAHDLFEQQRNQTIFLRAPRQADGTRIFKLIEAEPLDTSYGEDLYKTVFVANTLNE